MVPSFFSFQAELTHACFVVVGQLYNALHLAVFLANLDAPKQSEPWNNTLACFFLAIRALLLGLQALIVQLKDLAERNVSPEPDKDIVFL